MNIFEMSRMEASRQTDEKAGVVIKFRSISMGADDMKGMHKKTPRDPGRDRGEEIAPPLAGGGQDEV